MIQWDSPLKTKYLTFVYGSEWERCDVKLMSYSKTPLGWDLNIWRLAISYDDYGKVKRR